MVTVSPNFLLIAAPLSPLKFNPLLILVTFVLTLSLTDFNWSSVAARPLTAWGLSAFQDLLSSPVTKLPFAPPAPPACLPIVTVPAFTVSAAVIVVTLRSFFNLRPILVSSPVWLISVVILSSPFTVTLEPSLFVLVPPVSASNLSPVLITSFFAVDILLFSSVLALSILPFSSVLASLIFLLSSVLASPIFLFNSVLASLILLFNSVLAAWSWPPLTASLELAATSPSATLVIFLSFALMPFGVT